MFNINNQDYKLINNYRDAFDIEYVKDKYQLRINDRISKTLDNIDKVSNVLKILK